MIKKCAYLFFTSGAWALGTVLFFHTLVRFTPWRTELDWVMHYSGGLAIAWFMYCTIPLFGRFIGELTVIGRFVAAYCAGCTVALFWDIAEFSSDQLLGTEVQHSLTETMMDLVNGVLGISTVIGWIALFALLKQLKPNVR